MADDRGDPSLGGLIANYLRDKRQRANLTQRQLAEMSQGRVGQFDHSWVSQWEQRGPKQGLVKALTYLGTVGADFELLTEMLRLPIEIPTFKTEPTAQAAIKSARSAWREGRLGAALGWSVWAAQRAEDAGETRDAAAAWLTFSVAAKGLEGYRAAEYAVSRVLSFSEDDSGDEDLMALAGVQAATLAAWRGNTAHAEALLIRIERGPIADAMLAAMLMHAHGFVAAIKGDTPVAADAYRASVGAYVDPHPGLSASLRVCLALAEARLSRTSQALELLESAASDVQQASPLAQLVFEQVAGRVLMIAGDHGRALQSLNAAEARARELKLALILFEIYLSMHELAVRSKNAPLASLMRRKLKHQRQRFKLNPRLMRAYEQSFPAGNGTKA